MQSRTFDPWREPTVDLPRCPAEAKVCSRLASDMLARPPPPRHAEVNLVHGPIVHCGGSKVRTPMFNSPVENRFMAIVTTRRLLTRPGRYPPWSHFLQPWQGDLSARGTKHTSDRLEQHRQAHLRAVSSPTRPGPNGTGRQQPRHGQQRGTACGSTPAMSRLPPTPS